MTKRDRRGTGDKETDDSRRAVSRFAGFHGRRDKVVACFAPGFVGWVTSRESRETHRSLRRPFDSLGAKGCAVIAWASRFYLHTRSSPITWTPAFP